MTVSEENASVITGADGEDREAMTSFRDGWRALEMDDENAEFYSVYFPITFPIFTRFHPHVV